MRLTSWLNPARRRSPRPARGAGGARPHLERLEERTVPSIVSENQLAGTPSTVWDTDHADDYTVRGYVSGFSLNRGQAATFKVEMLDPVTGTEVGPIPFHIQIFRMGYYQGNGARQVAFANGLVNQAQPLATYDLTTGLVDGGNWHASYTWAIPAAATSGVYFAKVTRDDGVLGTDGRAASNHVFFVVRDDGGHSDVLFKTADATWQAYNFYGGSSLYYSDPSVFPAQNFPYVRGYQVSYNRPFSTLRGVPPVDAQAYPSTNWVFYSEYPMIRWLEANGYNVSYFSDLDAQRTPGKELGHKIFLAAGHDEYWSQAMRDGAQAALARGVNLAFFGGNEVFERTVWLPGVGGSASDPRTMVCYKDSFNFDGPIPHPGGWTGTWDDASHLDQWTPRPENALTGQQYGIAGNAPVSLLVPPEDAQDRFWRNTSIASLRTGDAPASVQGVVGFEWNFPTYNGYQPPGLFQLSNTSFSGPSDGTYPPGLSPVTHALTLYRDLYGVGALVFGAGTINFSWALDNHHDSYQVDPLGMGTADFNYIAPVDQRVRQAVVNLFADMGNVQPGSLQPGLVRATPNNNHTVPTSRITSPVNGAVLTVGQPVTIQGTATANGNGVVSAVNVSTDNYFSFNLATGRTNWSYTWTPTTPGTATLLSQAVNDNGDLEAARITIQVQVVAGSAVALTSSANPSVYGQATTFLATVNTGGAAVGGSVTFKDGSAVLGVVPVDHSGQAAFSTRSLGAGKHNIQAVYRGSDVNPTGLTGLSQVVNRAPLTIRADDKARAADEDATPLTASYEGLVDDSPEGRGRALRLYSPGASSHRAGVYSITPTGDSEGNYNLTLVPATLTVQHAAVNTFRLTTSTPNPVAGESFTLTVTALDAFGNVATGYRGSVVLTGSNEDNGLLGQHTFTAADNGAFSFQVTLWRPGSEDLTVTDSATGWTAHTGVNVQDPGDNPWA